MKKSLAYKIFVYFLSVSLLLLMSGFTEMSVEAKEVEFPIGSIASRGEVKFEAKENVWKKVESSRFEIFRGTVIKTENGIAVITFLNNNKVKVGPDSLFSIDQNGRFILSQGNFEFCIPCASEMNFKAGNLFISKSQTFQATKDSSVVSPKNEETIGSISIHSNGAVTVKSIQGNLSVLNQDRVVLAAISSKDWVTIPSTAVGKAPGVMVAQIGGPSAASSTTSEEAGTFLGISTWGWVGIIAGVAAVAGIVAFGASSGGGGDREAALVCP
jgi:hypothetical protein